MLVTELLNDIYTIERANWRANCIAAQWTSLATLGIFLCVILSRKARWKEEGGEAPGDRPQRRTEDIHIKFHEFVNSFPPTTNHFY